MENAVVKFCRKVTTLLKPHASAIRAIGQVVVSSRRRASSRRRVWTQRAGCGAGDLGEPAGEVATAHPRVGREVVDGESLVEVGGGPVDRRAEVADPARLKHWAVDVLRLVALAMRSDDQMSRHRRCCGGAQM